ncbi:O-antigen ligase family protein [Cytobacillus oceanisediminis]|uniref:Putative inorganic carbon (HCO3(-)) transporter n=1 Tax=Cytobacillus oceanisediminis TaxID=665099 RepID=A0A562JNV6_9BACI|nr:putative inorganic carbon (HCO3(-)) transporter [Cytobacillus oceanisediminis]
MKKLLFIFILVYQLIYFPNEFLFTDTFLKNQFLMYSALILLIAFLLKNKQNLKDIFTLNKLIYIFIVLLIISTIFSVDHFLSFYGRENRYEGLVAWFCYLTLFTFSYMFIKMDKFTDQLYYFVYISFLVSMYGILQHFKLDFFPRYYSRVNQTRSYGFFDNPNFFGSYLVLVLAISLLVYFISDKKKSPIFLFILNTHFAALLYSQTRSAWLGVLVLLVFIGVFILLQNRMYFKKFFIASISFVVLFLAVNFTESSSISNRFTSIVKDANEAILEENMHAGSSRMYIWKKSFPLVFEYFWLGSGPDTLGEVFPYNEEEYEQYFHTTNIIVDKAHNEYLHMAITMGVPALFAYLALIFTILYKAFRALHVAEGTEFIILLCFIASIIGYLVQAFFNISVITVAPYYWIILGITYRFAEDLLKESQHTKVSTRNLIGKSISRNSF